MRKHATEQTGLTGTSIRQQEEAALYTVTADTNAESLILQQAMAIIERRMKTVDNQALTAPKKTVLYLQMRLGHLDIEVFGALWLNNRHQVLAAEDLFSGTLDTAAVYPREVVKKALQHNAAAVVFYHNHPSGHAEPSAPDLAITTKLKNALGVIEVRVLDHIVVAESCTSMAERNLL
ncbi:hypothetical protein CCR95_16455 [Thiocystis minor]|uniref:JAB domain-containing protein n=1 Tax=Thiocystis minor TaxID=61597 RepID=UPI0019123C48|nr:hypothetical protein [Thiocystis minor]